MALPDFEPAKSKAIEVANEFLRKTWGIDSYEQLAPAVLLHVGSDFNYDNDRATVYPLVLFKPTQDDWTARVIGQDPDTVFFCRENSGKRRIGIAFNKELFESGDWTFKGDLSKRINTDSEKIVFFASNKPGFFNTNRYTSQYSSIEDQTSGIRREILAFLGTLTNEISGEAKNLYLVEFPQGGPDLDLTKAIKMQVASWLRGRVTHHGKIFIPGKIE